MTKQEIYDAILKKNGRKHQIIVAIEELSELQKELTKFLRFDGFSENHRLSETTEELIDVTIIVEQLINIFDIDYQEFQERKNEKIQNIL
jgi:NTP pyrophosphatase (non-canonical NTP hydrolase)